MILSPPLSFCKPFTLQHDSFFLSSTLNPLPNSRNIILTSDSFFQSSTLSPYADYCANLVSAKQTLEAKKQEPAFQDFLQVST